MTTFITKAALAAVVALGALGATTQANAGSVDVDVRVRTPHVVVRTPHVVVRKPVVIVRPAPVVVVRPAYGRCAPGLALQKASNRGLNRVAISHVGPNRVTVSGKIRGMWAKVSFANVRGCPRL
jgi:hypothetical protein